MQCCAGSTGRFRTIRESTDEMNIYRAERVCLIIVTTRTKYELTILHYWKKINNGFPQGESFGKPRPVCRILWNNLPLQRSPFSRARQHPAQVCHLKCCQSCLCTAVARLRASSLECLFDILGGQNAEGDRYVGLESG